MPRGGMRFLTIRGMRDPCSRARKAVAPISPNLRDKQLVKRSSSAALRIGCGLGNEGQKPHYLRNFNNVKDFSCMKSGQE